MTEMDGDWCEERPTLIDSYGWALGPECFYLNYLNFSELAFQKHQVCKPKLETPQLMIPYFALMFRP